ADPRSGGHLYSQLSHAVAVLLYVTEERPVAVSAMANRLDSGIDCADVLAVRFESGMTASIAGTGTVHDHGERTEDYRVFASSGRLLLDTAGETLSTAIAGSPTGERTLSAGDLSPLPARRLVDTRLGLQPVHVSGSLGAQTVEVLAAARRSADKGGAVVRIESRDSGQGSVA